MTEERKAVLETIRHELQYRREKQWKIFSWSAALLLAAIGGVIVLVGGGEFVFSLWPQRVMMAIALVVIGAYAWLWVRENIKIEAESRASLIRMLKQEGLFCEVLPDPSSKPGFGYSDTIVLLAIAAVLTVVFAPTQSLSEGIIHMNQEFLRAGLNLLVALTTLGAGWFIGNRLSIKWNLVQKRRETDIANIQQFYLLYGGFKEIIKLWRVIKRNEDSSGLIVPSDSCWLLLARACAVESKSEAIIVKLATERRLETGDLKTLGLFRQSIQTLRESIRDDEEIPFASRGTEYGFFNDLTARVGLIISSSHVDKTLQPENASERLGIIANIRSGHFKEAIKLFEEAHPAYANP